MAKYLAVVKHLRKLYIGVASDYTSANALTTLPTGCWGLATDSSAWYVVKNGAWVGPITGGPSGSM